MIIEQRSDCSPWMGAHTAVALAVAFRSSSAKEEKDRGCDLFFVKDNMYKYIIYFIMWKLYTSHVCACEWWKRLCVFAIYFVNFFRFPSGLYISQIYYKNNWITDLII